MRRLMGRAVAQEPGSGKRCEFQRIILHDLDQYGITVISDRQII